MTTFATLQNRILNEINRNDLTAEVAEAIATAVDLHLDELVDFGDDRQTASTVNDQEWYPLPDNFIAMRDLLLTVNSHRYQLYRRTPQWINHNHNFDTGYTGRPEYYAVQDDQLRLWPVPNDSYELTAHYWRFSREWSASASGSATSGWGNSAKGYHLIRVTAKRHLYREVIRGREDDARLMEREEQRWLGSLRRQTSKKLATGRIRKRL